MANIRKFLPSGRHLAALKFCADRDIIDSRLFISLLKQNDFNNHKLSDVDCYNPSPIVNGTVTLAANVTYYGSAALYECNDNFKLDGVSRRICSEDGKWSGEEPKCVEITCPSLNVSEHLIVDEGMRLVGQIAKFSCTKGRILSGNSTRTCLANGRWAGKNPTCKRK